jgi:hypothetical protein
MNAEGDARVMQALGDDNLRLRRLLQKQEDHGNCRTCDAPLTRKEVVAELCAICLNHDWLAH